MAFHVEVRRGMQRARVFNLAEPELAALAQAWDGGRPVRVGEQDWDPAKSKLTVLEGPHLDAADLRFGQGWDAARRTAREVTPPRRAAVVVLGEDGWHAVRARLLAGEPPGVSAAVVVSEQPPFDVGLAVGALGADRVIGVGVAVEGARSAPDRESALRLLGG